MKGHETTADEVSTQKMVEDLKSVAHDAETLIKTVAQDLVNKPHEVRERLTKALASSQEAVMNMKNKLKEKAICAAKATDQAVRNHPYESIGVAMGIGLLIGILIRRK